MPIHPNWKQTVHCLAYLGPFGASWGVQLMVLESCVPSSSQVELVICHLLHLEGDDASVANL